MAVGRCRGHGHCCGCGRGRGRRRTVVDRGPRRSSYKRVPLSAEAVPKTAFRAGVSLSALAYSFSALNALGIKRGNGSQGPWLSESLVVRIPGYPRKCLVIVFSEPCFVTSEVPMRFLELRTVLSGSEKRDLQF